jgi:hypothetical protein
MKKHYTTFLVLSFIFFGAVPVLGQKFSVGAKLGIDLGFYSNFSDLKAEYEVDEIKIKRNPHTGFLGGLQASYDFSDMFGIQSELLFDRKGATYIIQDPDFETTKTKWSITYLTIPILLKIGFRVDDFNFFGVIGPYLGIGLGGKISTLSIIVLPVEFKKEPEDAFADVYMKRVDLGLTIGVVPSYKLGPGDIFLDIRANIGLLDVHNPNSKGDDYFAQCNRSIGLALGYKMKIGK